MNKTSFIFFGSMFSILSGISQTLSMDTQRTPRTSSLKEDHGPMMYRAIVVNGDTMPYISLNEVKISSTRTFKNSDEEFRFRKLKRDVKKVYPYALMAEVMLKEYSNQLKDLPKRKQDNFIKKAEQEMKDQFEDELKKLTVTQGKILMKLIDRQTGYTTYSLVKKLRGSFSAFMWQSMARLFDTSMKSSYDPAGEDRMIEEIIVMIENGEI